MMQTITAGLSQKGSQATVIEGGVGPHWHFVDLVPKNAGKGAAMHHVRQQLGFDESATVACGDSSNDLLMLDQANLAIVVGNSVSEVKTWALGAQQGQENNTAGATQHECVYLARQPAAAGMLEGLQAMDFL